MCDVQKARIFQKECGESTVGRRAPRAARGRTRSIAPTTVARSPSLTPLTPPGERVRHTRRTSGRARAATHAPLFLFQWWTEGFIATERKGRCGTAHRGSAAMAARRGGRQAMNNNADCGCGNDVLIDCRPATRPALRRSIKLTLRSTLRATCEDVPT